MRRDAPQPLGSRPLDGRVGGHDDAHVVAERSERLRERTGDIAEAAGLGERRDLGADEQNIHNRRLPVGLAVKRLLTGAPPRASVVRLTPTAGIGTVVRCWQGSWRQREQSA